MLLPTTTSLQMYDVYDRGVPNKERIVMRTAEVVNLQNYFIGVGITADGTMATPINGYTYYFADVLVPALSWVVVYTGSGQAQVSTVPPANDIAFTYHWGSPTVLFSQSEVVPLLFRVCELAFPIKPTAALPGPAKQQARLSAQR